MKIISFDVGIKNLAYCIIEFNNEYLSIKAWDTIDLCNEKKLCQYNIINTTENDKINIDKIICNNEAKYYKNNVYYCKKHTKKLEYSIPSNDFNDKNLKKMKLEDLINFCIINNITIQKPYTKKTLLENINDYKKINYLEEIKCKNASQYDLIYLGIQLKEQLNVILNLKVINDIDIAIIENQISPIANRMKTLQGMLAQYLIMNNLHNIIFYSASNKLKIFSLNSSETTYSERKKLSIQYTEQLLEEYKAFHDWRNIFNKHKKKDDLSDCFLQGLSYLIQNHNCKIIVL